MPTTKCNSCGGDYHWNWEDAFDKFGFGDGDGQIETDRVEDILMQAGYQVESQPWGLHNVVITYIKKEGRELIPYDDPNLTFGYDCPRNYLPEEIIDLLDGKLPASD